MGWFSWLLPAVDPSDMAVSDKGQRHVQEGDGRCIAPDAVDWARNGPAGEVQLSGWDMGNRATTGQDYCRLGVCRW